MYVFHVISNIGIWRASVTLSGEIRDIYYIYLYIRYMQDTVVARARWYVMWEELSVNHFLKCSNHW